MLPSFGTQVAKPDSGVPGGLTHPRQVFTMLGFHANCTGDLAMGMHRSALQRRRRSDAAATTAHNRPLKTQERLRRKARMIEKLKAGEPPYGPDVMSWLSRELGKKASRITSEDIKTFVT